MEYSIVAFNSSLGQILVDYVNPVDGGVWRYAIDLPITEGKYPEGSALAEVIQANAPVWQVERHALVSIASNAGSIAALVAKQAQESVNQSVLSDAEVARNKRNTLLALSDWTQVADYPYSAESQKAWAIYRQQLRDITTQVGFPTGIMWPESPM